MSNTRDTKNNVDISNYHQILTYSLVYDSDTFIVYLGGGSGKAEVNTEEGEKSLVHLIGFDPGSIDEDKSLKSQRNYSKVASRKHL